MFTTFDLFRLLAASCLILFAGAIGCSHRLASSASVARDARVTAAAIPLSFEANQGQADRDVKFLLRAVAVDAQGNVSVAGATSSINLPLVQPIQAGRGGPPTSTFFLDAFVATFHASGAALLFSTYLGGADRDEANGVAVDASGHLHVAGHALSTDFPTANAMQPALGGRGSVGFGDAFVVKIAP